MPKIARIWLFMVILMLMGVAVPYPAIAQDDSSPVITQNNAAQLQLLERLGRGVLTGPIIAGATPNTVIVPTTLGFYVWDYTQPDVEPRLIPTHEPMFGALPSPDGQFMAARADNGEVSVWDTTTGEITFTRGLPPPQAIGAGGMAWSANSQALAVGTWDDTVSVFDPRTGDTLAFFASGITIEINGYVDPASLTSLSPDGTRLVWGSFGARVELRSVGGDDDVYVTITRRDDQIHMMGHDWSDNSRYLAVSMSDSRVRVYDAISGEIIKELAGTLGAPLGAMWQPGTSTLLYSTGVHWWQWDAESDEMVGRIPAPEGNYVWSPDGTQMAVAGAEGVHILDMSTGDTVQELSQEPVVQPSLDWSPNGTYLLLRAENQAMHWNVETGELIGSTILNRSIWLEGGDRLAFYTPDSRTVWVVEAADGSPVATLRDFSEQADRLFWGSDGLQYAVSSFSGAMTTITNAEGKIIHHLPRPDEITEYGFMETFNVAWSSDGTRFATISPRGYVKIWTLNKEWPAAPEVLDAPDPNNLAFSPDDRLIITTGWDDEARVYDGTTYQLITTLTGFDDPTNAAAFSPDGQYVAVGSYDMTVQVFDTTTWARIASLPNYNYTYAKPNIAFSPDGTTLAYPNRASGITLWNVAEQSLIETTTDLFGGGESLAWSPDSQLIAVGMYSGEIVVWDAANAQPLITLNEATDYRDFSRPINTLLFSPDGTQLVIGGEDSTIQIWGIAE